MKARKKNKDGLKNRIPPVIPQTGRPPEPQAPVADSPTPSANPAQAVPLLVPRPAGLYTQCPQCQTTYRVTAAHLRIGRGLAQCQQCLSTFNALDALDETPLMAAKVASAGNLPPRLSQLDAVSLPTAETATRMATQRPSSQLPRLGQLDVVDRPAKASILADFDGAEESLDLPWQHDRQAPRRPWLWGGGSLLLLALLAAQGFWYEGPFLLQNKSARLWLERACQELGCVLPPFRAPSLFYVLSHDFTPAANNVEGYEFSLVFVNDAPLPQAYPAIKLTLDGNGTTAATRLFKPGDYLAKDAPPVMAQGEIKQVRLLLAKPSREVDGFSFELL